MRGHDRYSKKGKGCEVRGIVLLTLVALMCGCTGEDPEDITEIAINKSDILECNRIPDLRLVNNCSTRVAVSAMNTSICMMIKDDSWKYGCVAQIASIKKDTRVCNIIKHQRGMEECMKLVASGKS